MKPNVMHHSSGILPV